MRRPPLVVVLIAVFVMALGETAGAVMSQMRPQTERYTLARVAGNPGVHGLTGSAEYDDEVRARAVFAVEAGHRRHPRVARRARHAARARHMTEAAHPTWRLPPTPALLVALLLIACAEIGGASMVRFKLELARWARGTMLARPEIHGLVGVRDVDEQIMDEALTRFDGGLRLFHMHAEGMGTIVILTTRSEERRVGKECRARWSPDG